MNLQITELEYTALIKMSGRDNVVQATFGANVVTLLDTPQNEWAINMLKSMRDANKSPNSCNNQ